MSPEPKSVPRSGLFSDASQHLMDRLGQIVTAEVFQPDEVVFSQGDPGDAAFFIESGQLEVSVLSADGKRLALDILQPGDVVGEIALFDDGSRTATITARHQSRLLRLSRNDLGQALGADPELAMEMLNIAGARMRWLTQQIHEQALLTLQERLARKILHLTQTGDDDPIDTLDMAQGELAEFLAVTREAVSKTLTGWKQIGLIELQRGRLIILDRPGLRMRAGVSFF